MFSLFLQQRLKQSQQSQLGQLNAFYPFVFISIGFFVNRNLFSLRAADTRMLLRNGVISGTSLLNKLDTTNYLRLLDSNMYKNSNIGKHDQTKE